MAENHTRHLDTQILGHFRKYKQVLVLLGARQVGKTTLLKRLFPNSQYLLIDNASTKDIFEKYDISAYKQLINSNSTTVIIDEIHLLSDPGRAVKILFDQIENLHLVITGSSSLSVKNKTTESLAGRKIDYKIYPLTFSEYLYQLGIENSLNSKIADNLVSKEEKSTQIIHNFDLKSVLENVLTYGLYPNIVNNPQDKKYLENLVDSVVFKDLLELKLIENRSIAVSLLTLLAHQIGNLVSYLDIANRLSIDVRTVKKYIDIFEQSFIVFRLFPYSTKQRDEIGKMPKIYFYDLGLRNALISNFSVFLLRNDIGASFENFIICEFLKLNAYFDLGYKMNYWRLKQGSEVDLVLQKPGGDILGVEIKYSKKEMSSVFKNRYPSARAKLITSENFYS